MEVGGLPIEEVRVDTVEMVFDLCGSPTVLGLSIHEEDLKHSQGKLYRRHADSTLCGGRPS